MWNISHVSVDLNLRVGNVTQDKNGTVINVSVSVEKPIIIKLNKQQTINNK